MRLLALDQASRTSGYAVFIDDKLETYGQFTLSDSDIGVRLFKFRNKILELIEKYQIDFVIFEDIQLQTNIGNNVATFKALAEVFGVVYELVTELKIQHQYVLAITWKSTLGIKGKTRPEQKANAQKYVEQKYNVKVKEDTADAICIGSYYQFKTTDSYDWSD